VTERETAKIMSIMQTVYPDSFHGLTKEALSMTVKVWTKVFEDDPASAVQAAVMAHISASADRFMPPPGAIKQRLIGMTTNADMTPQEAWQLVNAATQRGIFHTKDEFDKLPPVVQRIVGSPNQLKEWAMMDAETVQSVISSNFQRSYTVRAEKEREYMALPTGVKNTLAEISGKLGFATLPGGAHED
jgi:hypothetical protein